MWRLDELASLVQGKIVGGPSEVMIVGAASVSRAEAGHITLVTSLSYLRQLESSSACAVVVPHHLQSEIVPCIQVDQPEVAFAKIVALFRPKLTRPIFGISPQATVSPSAKLEEDVCIHPGAVIMDNVTIKTGTVVYPNVTIMENCQIGAHVKIFPGVVLYENTEVGDRCIIHSNAVVGAFGFGYSTVEGAYRLAPQLGNVRIESDVEIGANTTIDRGTFDSTVIGAGTKLDNLVMVGHNCQIGPNNLLCSQVGIAGSCETGEYVTMGGQVGMKDHLKIGSHVSIGAQSGVMHDIENNTSAFGSPARPMREEMQILAIKTRLPEMRNMLRDLQHQCDSLRNDIAQLSDSREPQPFQDSNFARQKAA